jgi:putative hydrolase of the HAD superfamily
MNKRPKVIFLDAVGTLFGVRDSVGAAYGAIARQFGVDVDEHALNTAFFQSFRAASPLAFPGATVDEIRTREYEWWRAIAHQTFDQVGALSQFSEFDGFFSALYRYFATADPWFVYPDVMPMLEQWRSQSIPLAVVSNFDSRIYSVLPALGLAPYLDSVTISTEVGAAKPDPRVFETALKKHDCLPTEAWHIGDSRREDYEGAKALGLRAIWLKR